MKAPFPLGPVRYAVSERSAATSATRFEMVGAEVIETIHLLYLEHHTSLISTT
jgi:hypothetical protein